MACLRHLGVHLVMDLVCLDDLATHRVVRIHRRQRVLEDHGHPLSAQAADVLGTLAQQVLAVQEDLAAQSGARTGLVRRLPVVQTHDREAGHALSGTGLAHDAEGAAALNAEAQPVNGLHQSVVGREVDAEV